MCLLLGDARHDQDVPMTGDELRAVRVALRLSVIDFGTALGYAGKRPTIATAIHKMERDMRPVPRHIERLATMFGRFGVPPEYLQASEARRPG